MAKRENDLGRDPIGKLLLRLAVPTVTAGRRSSARQSAALTVTTALSGGGRAQERKQFIL